MHARETPSQVSRRLLRAWLLLVGLTLLSLVAVLGFGHSEAGIMAVAVALAASFLKARAVLDHFLDLRRAGSGWRGFFHGSLALILVVLFATYLVAGW
ncbi:MAG: cytochrome C oxidase subunit IV family protein [Magnetospirillum sp.]|nr:cytochrome C oxidase subunit IV family protein [Magnetospirillum sp.]